MTRSELPLSSNQIDQILRAAPPKSILIGGQALAFWAKRYQVPIPSDLAYLTRDLGFLGDSDQAEELAQALHGTLYLPTLEDHTPNTARIILEIDAKHYLGIDFLGSIVGMDSGAIERRAVVMELPDKNITIMHPVDCLESRCANLCLLPGKRGKEAIAQAAIGIRVVRVFFQEMIAAGREREALKIVERLANIAASDIGKRVFTIWDIDLLQAIPSNDFDSQDFKGIRWPQMVAYIREKRQRFLRRYL